jgi:hypothetical protein
MRVTSVSELQRGQEPSLLWVGAELDNHVAGPSTLVILALWEWN